MPFTGPGPNTARRTTLRQSLIVWLSMLAMASCGCHTRQEASKPTTSGGNVTSSRAPNSDSKAAADSPGADADGAVPQPDDPPPKDSAPPDSDKPAQIPDSATTTPEDPSSASTQQTDQAEPEVTAAPRRQRFVLYTPSGPLVVELDIRIDGKSLDETFENLVDHVQQIADTDQDGRPTWEEISTSRRFIYGQLGNVEINNEQERRRLIEMYDTDSDGTVDRTEIPRFLTRGAGQSQAFSLQSSNFNRDLNLRASPIRLLLDQDRDGLLTEEEIAACEQSLRQRDMDDDEILLPGDLSDEAAAQSGRLPNQKRPGPEVAAQLGSSANWYSILVDMQDYYSFGGTMTADNFALAPRLFQDLDQDQDGELSRSELQRLNDVSPQVVLGLDLGGKRVDAPADADAPQEPPDNAPVRSPWTVAHWDACLGEMGDRVTMSGPRLTMRLAGVFVEFFVNDQAGGMQQTMATQMQFNALDQDANGYLDKDEAMMARPLLGASFEAVDADADEKIYLEEIHEFFEQRQAAYRAQVRVRVADHADAMFAALDADGDGRLSAREMTLASDRIARLDQNADGKISQAEMPGSMIVGVVRGDPQQLDVLFTPPTATFARTDQSVPDWFIHMDVNADGDISRREFLGTAAQFEQLDTDQDGFINATELDPSAIQARSASK